MISFSQCKRRILLNFSNEGVGLESKAYLILLGIYIVDYVFTESQINNYLGMQQILFLVRYAVLSLLAVLIIVRNRAMPTGPLVGSIVLVCICLLNIALLGGGLGPLPLVIFAFGSQGESVKRIMKVAVAALVVSYLFVITLSWMGVLNDVVRSRTIGSYAGGFFSGKYVRHNTGFLISNQVPMAIMAAYFMWVAIRGDAIKWYGHLIAMVINVLAFYYYGSRVIFILMSLGCFLFLLLKRRSIPNSDRNSLTLLVRLRKQPSPLFLVCPVCAAFSILMTLIYSDGGEFASFMNLHLNNRLRFASDVMSEYGVGILGISKDIGSTNFAEMNTVVDNGYLIDLLRQGVLGWLVVIFGFSYLILQTERSGNKHIAVILAIVAIQNIVDASITDVVMIPYYCLLFNRHDELLNECQISRQLTFQSARPTARSTSGCASYCAVDGMGMHKPVSGMRASATLLLSRAVSSKVRG